MREEEFVKELNKLGFNTEHFHDKVYIIAGNKDIGSVTEGEKYKLDSDYEAFSDLESDVQLALLDLMIEYAKTPVEERVNPKKYRLTWNFDVASMNENDTELALNEMSNRFYFVKPWEDFQFKRKFTEEEISNFPQKIKRLITLEYLILEEVN